jgi:hypothetical protein
VKGLGIPSLKQHDMVTRLRDACTEGSVGARQGSLFAFECLADRLGLLFEPYVISVVPALLKVFNYELPIQKYLYTKVCTCAYVNMLIEF